MSHGTSDTYPGDCLVNSHLRWKMIIEAHVGLNYLGLLMIYRPTYISSAPRKTYHDAAGKPAYLRGAPRKTYHDAAGKPASPPRRAAENLPRCRGQISLP